MDDVYCMSESKKVINEETLNRYWTTKIQKFKKSTEYKSLKKGTVLRHIDVNISDF